MTTAQSAIRLGIVDTDSELLEVLENRLVSLGWEHRVFESAVPPEALAAMRLDALVIDVEMLGARPWSYLEAACAQVPSMGVLVLTGRSTVARRVRALRLGADDWIAKPCDAEELIARVEAVVRRRRRVGAPRVPEPLRTGELEIRADTYQVLAGTVAADLTRREFELLEVLVAAGGHVLRREEIYARVWGFTMVHGDRSVDVFVRKLRQKLDRVSPGWRYIHTHVGIGYRFEAETVDATEHVGHP